MQADLRHAVNIAADNIFERDQIMFVAILTDPKNGLLRLINDGFNSVIFPVSQLGNLVGGSEQPAPNCQGIDVAGIRLGVQRGRYLVGKADKVFHSAHILQVAACFQLLFDGQQVK